ncbi:TonB-dependent receptor [Pseudomaricurvus alkylphenolicus]|uniref:TonB-dependent receptor n=1 Tax=Pseudomaricurvus alkylphenolicus TaxID=1306991 RepID=UPI00141ECC1D|nr:TonB-dependent receptor [Pseudomaricurvus alkylphenolicus]NIB39818.1 TonB-dependent receptor [Pseudomaricurvus alkylphenolicus]
MSKNTESFDLLPIAAAITSAAMIFTGVNASAETASELAIEEIIVTAQKRATSLQDTPIAISAFDASSLESLGATSVIDIAEYTPNVTMTRSLGSKYNVRMNIRGMGTAEPSLAVDPKVGVYLDGVYMARNSGAVFDIVDLERVEVLRGPQGTLWGKNTTGGAVNMITAKPRGELGFKQQLTTGSDGLFKSVSTIDTPELGGVSAKLTYAHKAYDGWAKNIHPHTESELGSEKTDAYRVALLWQPSDNFSASYSFDKTNGEAVAAPNQLSDVIVPADAPIGLTIDTVTGAGIAGNPFAAMAAVAEPDKRLDTFNMDSVGAEHVDIQGHNLTLSWVMGDVELKSISAYRHYEAIVESLDTDGVAYTGIALDPAQNYQAPLFPIQMAPVYIFNSSNQKSQQQFSQEFQAIGSALEERLNYVVGLYYFEEDGKELNPWQITIYNPMASPFAALSLNIGSFYKIESKSEALFGQFTYDVDEQLSVTLGLRYSKDEKTLTLLSEDPGLLQDHSESEDWSKFTAALTANYQLNNDISLYAKVSEGYASGLFNPGTIGRASFPADTSAALTPVDPEEVLSWELGMKSTLLNNRLRINLATFYNDNTNLQVTDFVGGIRRSFNSGESTTTGLELDAVAVLAEGLMLNVSAGYLDVDFDDATKTQSSPRDTATLGLEYSFAPLSFGQLVMRLDATYTGSSRTSFNDPDTAIDSRTLLNARIGLEELELGKGSLRVAAWARNLTDEEYRFHGANFSFYRGYTWGDPRSVGVDVIYEF